MRHSPFIWVLEMRPGSCCRWKWRDPGALEERPVIFQSGVSGILGVGTAGWGCSVQSGDPECLLLSMDTAAAIVGGYTYIYIVVGLEVCVCVCVSFSLLCPCATSW